MRITLFQQFFHHISATNGIFNIKVLEILASVPSLNVHLAFFYLFFYLKCFSDGDVRSDQSTAELCLKIGSFIKQFELFRKEL